MTNYDPNDQQTVARFILDNLPGHKQFALGTIDDSGKPWVVCLSSAFDNDLTFLWVSAAGTEHSQHIAARPDVSICIFSDNEPRGDFGFYTKCTAHEVTDEAELTTMLGVRFSQKGKEVPPASEYMGKSPMRLYAATINEAWVIDDGQHKTAVDLTVLRQLAKA
jgi:hypothetical protein